MENFHYKGGYGICEHMCLEALKRTAGLAIDKWLQVINYTMSVTSLRKYRIKMFLHQARACHRPACTWFLKIISVPMSVCVCVCVCVL